MIVWLWTFISLHLILPALWSLDTTSSSDTIYQLSSTLLLTFYFPKFIHSVHPVFHVSMLKSAMSNSFSERTQLASAPVIIDGEPEYEIFQIVDSKIDCWCACILLYKVIWLGYKDTKDESEWIPTSELIYALTWYLISILHTPPSPVYSFYLDHTVILVFCLYALLMKTLFIIFLVYSIYLFSFNPSFYTLFLGFFFNFQTLIFIPVS